jgi:hypothetical protein
MQHAEFHRRKCASRADKIILLNNWQSLLLQESQSFYGIEDYVQVFSKKWQT